VADRKKVFEEGEIANLRQKLARLYSDYANVKKLSKDDYQQTAFELICQLEKLTTLTQQESALKDQLIKASTGGAAAQDD
jgi:DnaJ-domain-containing protein 1